jgi:hypothetical protein
MAHARARALEAQKAEVALVQEAAADARVAALRAELWNTHAADSAAALEVQGAELAAAHAAALAAALEAQRGEQAEREGGSGRQLINLPLYWVRQPPPKLGSATSNALKRRQ